MRTRWCRLHCCRRGRGRAFAPLQASSQHCGPQGRPQGGPHGSTTQALQRGWVGKRGALCFLFPSFSTCMGGSRHMESSVHSRSPQLCMAVCLATLFSLPFQSLPSNLSPQRRLGSWVSRLWQALPALLFCLAVAMFVSACLYHWLWIPAPRGLICEHFLAYLGTKQSGCFLGHVGFCRVSASLSQQLTFKAIPPT